MRQRERRGRRLIRAQHGDGAGRGCRIRKAERIGDREGDGEGEGVGEGASFCDPSANGAASASAVAPSWPSHRRAAPR